MRRLATLAWFVIVIGVVFTTFAPLGAALGEGLHTAFGSLASGGDDAATALGLLIAVYAAGIALAFAGSFAGGVRLPSGLPQVSFALLLPLTAGAMQARFFELAGGFDGLGDTFGAYGFIAMFVLAVAVSQAGVSLARRRFEGRER